MPKQRAKLGYVCPICGRDDGWEEDVTSLSTRKRGRKTHVRSERYRERMVYSDKPSSMLIESEPKNVLMDGYEIPLLNITAEWFMRSIKDGSWYRTPEPHQEQIFKGIAELRSRARSRKEVELQNEVRIQKWDIFLTKEDSPFYELARKLSSLYNIGNNNHDDKMEMTCNSAKEIMRSRRAGDPLLYLDTSELRQIRVLHKYPLLAERIRNGPEYPMMEKGAKVLNRYREPHSDRRWVFSWVEWFWIVLHAHVVSPREAVRMVRTLDGQRMRKLSPEHIKNQIKSVIQFWLDFFEYVPHYLAFLNIIGWVIENDTELSKLDHQDSVQQDTKTYNIMALLASKHLKEVLNHDSSKDDNDAGTRSDFGFRKLHRRSKQLILIRHPNLNYRKELDEFKGALKPQRKTSSCYFDPWEQSLEVLGALIKKGIIHLK